MKNIFKKGEGVFPEIRSRKVGVMGISEVGLSKIVVGLTKSYIKSCIRRVGGMGVMFAAVFLAVWVVMPANGAEAAD